MPGRYLNGEIVSGGAAAYRIDGGIASFGRFATSYKALRPDGSPVFLKQYKAPTRIDNWYGDYIAYQKELKKRVNSDPTLSSRTYDFVDMFEAPDAFVQVFGFLEKGDNLRKRLDGGIRSPYMRWEFAEALVSALARFHDAGIVHTDLKPENIFLMPGALGSGWNVKLIDFDFTVLSGMTAPWRGKEGFEGWVGTPRYMSPEHLAGKVPEARSDVFTASLILHELLAECGHPYPEGDDEYRAAVRSGPPAPPRLWVAASSETDVLALAMALALSPDINERPTTDKFLAALRAAGEAFRKSNAAIPSPAPPEPRPEPAPKPITTPAPAPPPGPRHLPVPAGAVLLAGSAGNLTMRLDSEFGRKSLASLIGEEDAHFTDAKQFHLSRKPDTGEWLVAAASDVLPNPPMLDGAVLSATLVPVRNGSVLFAATSRKNPDMRKGRIEIHL